MNEERVVNFAGNMRFRRKRIGVSQAAFASALAERGPRVDATAITRIENGQRRVTLHEALNIADLVGLTVLEMCEPMCPVCGSVPPEGFTCNVCGRTS